MKLTNNFWIQEFVPEKIYKQYGSMSVMFLDKRIVDLAQKIRDMLGCPIYINTWMDGGILQERGYRLPTTGTGSELSQHKRGAAFDFHSDKKNTLELMEFVKEKYSVLKEYGLTTMEANTPTWVHLDIRWVMNNDKLLIVPYK